tara:strand:+ start:6053 stop:6604 length:552 start_codon:yes stop_codon:yes gene_type:complete
MKLLDPQLRVLSHVPRWAIIRTIREQNVAEHSYFVAVYAKEIAEFVNLDQSEYPMLVWVALMHDIDEMVTGDIPTPSKERHLYIQQHQISRDVGVDFSPDVHLSIAAHKILKIADCFEAVMFLMDEQYLGNKTVHHLTSHLTDQLQTMCDDLHIDLFNHLSAYLHDTTRTKLMTEDGWVKGSF